MSILAGFFKVLEKVTTDRAHALAQEVETSQSVNEFDYAYRLKKLEGLGFLRVTMFS